MKFMVRKGQWHDYKNGKKKEYGEFVRKAREFTYARPAPPIYRNTTPKGGKPNKNDPRALVICLLLKIWLIGLKVLPGRMDLQRAMNRLTKNYLDSLNSFILEQGYYGKKARSADLSAPLIALASPSGGT